MGSVIRMDILNSRQNCDEHIPVHDHDKMVNNVFFLIDKILI